MQGGWENTRTYREVLQDWRGWMEEGILDLNIPMNYKREHFTTEPNNQRRMYEEWNEFARDHQYARDVAIGAAIYLNFVAEQRHPGEEGAHAERERQQRDRLGRLLVSLSGLPTRSRLSAERQSRSTRCRAAPS